MLFTFCASFLGSTTDLTIFRATAYWLCWYRPSVVLANK
jgi:hypothetical protein